MTSTIAPQSKPRSRFRDSLGALLDSCIEAWKWPIAIVALVLTIPLGYAALRLCLRLLASYWICFGFLLGIGLYALVWRRFSDRLGFGKWFLAAEHELTHALFALLTFHRIRSIHAGRDGKGRVEFDGRGNWMIALAPYFFPTAPLLLVCLASIISLPFLPVTAMALGFATAYHARSTWNETHSQQTDLQRAGLLFSCLVLPAANLLTIGFLIACMVDGAPTLFFGDAAAFVRSLLPIGVA